MASSTNADVLAAALAEREIEYVFGLPGGEVATLVDACRRVGIEFVLTGHEASAAFMAQAIGQLTGRPGVCMSTLGPGATNLVTGVANAMLDRHPMVAITAQTPIGSSNTLTHQRLPLSALFAPITKQSIVVETGRIDAQLARAFDIALQPRPGPVHIAVPSDISTESCPRPGADPRRDTIAATSRHDQKALNRVRDQIASCVRPLVLVGLGVRPADLAPLHRLIDALDAPVIVTAKAKGAVRHDHSKFLGVASGMARDDVILETIRSADLVVAVGFDPVECDKTWFAACDVVAVDAVSMREGDYRPLEVVGDTPMLLDGLASMVERRPWPDDLLRARREAIEPPVTGRDDSAVDVLMALRAGSADDAILASDVGSHKFVAGQWWPTFALGDFLVSNGLSSMGYALPAAIAAQIRFPERPVIALVGDGGMLMMAHCLQLVASRKLPIVTLVLTDGSLSLIRLAMERRGIEPAGVDFDAPDFVRLASAFGIDATRPTSLRGVQEAVERAFSRRTPVVVEVPIDARLYASTL